MYLNILLELLNSILFKTQKYFVGNSKKIINHIKIFVIIIRYHNIIINYTFINNVVRKSIYKQLYTTY